MLNSTAFGRLMTMLVKELCFDKRKEGTVAMYYGVGITTEPKFEPANAESMGAQLTLEIH